MSNGAEYNNVSDILFSKDLKLKREQYRGPMRWAAYPLFYATCLDVQQALQEGKTYSESRLMRLREENPPRNLLETPIQRKKIIADLEAQNIAYTLKPQLIQYSAEFGNDGVDPEITTYFSFASENDEEMNRYSSGFERLAGLCVAAFQPNSLTSRVLTRLEEVHEEAHDPFFLAHIRRTVIDGILSTYHAGVDLSQHGLVGSVQTREDDFKSIFGTSVITNFTQQIAVTVLTQLGKIRVFPKNQIRYIGSELLLHPDLESFTSIANLAVNKPQAHPMICPFAYPLGKTTAEEAIRYYQEGSHEVVLPIEVTRFMETQQFRSGIDTASQIIHQLLTI